MQHHMKKTNAYILSSSLIIFFSCNFLKKEKEVWPPPRNKSVSYEIVDGDTCNRLIYGYKQGKWFIREDQSYNGMILDTVYYRNDTVIEKP